MKRLPLLLCAVLALTACDNNGTGVATSVFTPTQTHTSASAWITPQTIPFATLNGFGCPFGSPFSTTFGVVISPSQKLTVDSVTLRLSDGSSLGGSSVTFPQPQLTRMFGSTLVIDTRVFEFNPSFVCGAGVPLSVTADIVFIDASGTLQTMTTTASFK